jgi:CRISPR-associated protein Csd2
MTTQAYLDPARRHDFVLLFDVQDGNPNGDPDAGNLPRVDPETMQGMVTDVCLKRKVRDWVDATRGGEGAYKIYVQSGEALNTKHQRAYDALGLESTGSKQDRGTIDETRAWMCQNFYDVRTFGAVMTTGVNCGQVRGPMQLTFGRSLDPVTPLDITITRVAVTKEEDAQVVVGDDGKTSGKQSEMGRKALVPYGLYMAHGFYNPHLAEQTGFGAEDLALFWQALGMMFELDRSASRGMMALRGLVVFSHESKMGEVPAHVLFDRVCAARREGVSAPRQFADYVVSVDEEGLPAGVQVTRVVG